MTPCETTYQETQNQIYQLCWQAQKRWGGEFDDYLSSANLAWAKAYKGWDASKNVKFNTYMHKAVWNSLLDEYDDHIRYSSKNKSIPEELDFASTTSRFDALLSDLSDDAKLIVKLIFETPAGLTEGLSIKHPKESKQSIWKYLRNHLDWNMARTINAFQEIQEVS